MTVKLEKPGFIDIFLFNARLNILTNVKKKKIYVVFQASMFKTGKYFITSISFYFYLFF